MDKQDNGIICTKRKLWKRKNIVKDIVDYMIKEEYTFEEVVIGEPNNFIFADEYHEIDGLFTKKGFFGIRIKFRNDDSIIEISSNTNGLNNVLYNIFSKNTETLQEAKNRIEDIKNIIGTSSEALVISTEFLERQRRIRNIVVIILVLIGLYFFNVHVLLLNLVSILYSFLPFLFIYLLIDRFRRR